MAVVRKAWSRDELLVGFDLYCRIPFGRLHHGNGDVIKLVGVLGCARTYTDEHGRTRTDTDIHGRTRTYTDEHGHTGRIRTDTDAQGRTGADTDIHVLTRTGDIGRRYDGARGSSW